VSRTNTHRKGTSPVCDYEGSTYRTDFWEGQGRTYEDLAERVALTRLLPPRGKRLLDIGAGFGRLADMYGSYDEVILLDYSRSQLEYAREHLGDERYIYVAADIYRLPLATNVVDTTVMVRVLHHLADVPLAFAHIERVTRPAGTFVLEFANKRHLKNILRHLLGRGLSPFAQQPHEFAELHYDFHPAWVAARLAQAGFKVQERLSVSLLRAQLLKRIVPARLLAAVDGLLQRPTAPLALGPSIFLCAQVTKPGPQEIAPRALLFRCPACGRQPLVSVEAGVRCDGCQTTWPLEKGIYVFK
jgi:SAM-dependent methyltransferase